MTRDLMRVIEQILQDGHLSTETLAHLRAEYEAVAPEALGQLVSDSDEFPAALDAAPQGEPVGYIHDGPPLYGEATITPEPTGWNDFPLYAAPQTSSWIKCSERMPDGEDLLCIVGAASVLDEPYIVIANWNGDDEWFCSNRVAYEPDEITHWAPLPPFPAPVENHSMARAVTYTVDGTSVCLTDCVNTSEPPTAPDYKLRKSAGNALEVLEALQAGCTDSDDGTVEAITVHCPEVIAALREALGGEE